MTAGGGAADPVVTVCIPSYKSADFIGQTLASVADQTMPGFRALIAIEPDGADETIGAIAGFLEDGRFDYYVNSINEGYAPNTRALLRRVKTPYFAVLPHDDMWHPRYLEVLLGRLAERPDASAAYGDLFTFGQWSGNQTSTEPTDGPLYERLLAWFLLGAEGNLWHGVGRTRLLDKPFPDNGFNGFAVECEWSLHVLLSGPVLHDPMALYLKREQPEDSETGVSVGWRNRTTEEWLRRALEHHRGALIGPLGTAGLEPEQLRMLELAAEAAVAQRRVTFFMGRYNLSTDDELHMASLFGALEDSDSAAAQRILARLHLAASHDSLLSGRPDIGLQHAEKAASCDPKFGDAQKHLTRLYVGLRRPTDAIVHLRAMAELLPLHPGSAIMLKEIAEQLARLGLKQSQAAS